jgi:hypothetical protein
MKHGNQINKEVLGDKNVDFMFSPRKIDHKSEKTSSQKSAKKRQG